MRITKTKVQAYTRVWFVGFGSQRQRVQDKIYSITGEIRKAMGRNGFSGKDRYVDIETAKLSAQQEPLIDFLEKKLTLQGLGDQALLLQSVWVITISLSGMSPAQRSAVGSRIETLPGARIVTDVTCLTGEIMITTSSKPSKALIRSVKQALSA